MLMGAWLLAGCGGQPYRTEERLDRGLVIVLPGIEGRSQFNRAIVEGLNDGGVNWAIETYDWTSALGPLYNLRAEERNHRKANEIAWRILRYQWAYPNRPVVLVGQSGGGAMAVWAAESMLPGVKVNGIILLAASLSPKYSLDLALGNSQRGVINFYSSLDVLVSGLGTALSGTMDGRHTMSAGQVGFEVPKIGPTVEVYRRLQQIAWKPQMASSGNPGLHLTSGARRFVAEYVAPFIMAEPFDVEWDESAVTRILGHDWLEEVAPPASEPAH
jgi:pimeloyl-ACP methyl ester carboxylesterase